MANKEKNFASAVIYVHNDEKRIEDFLKKIIGVMEENFENSEIICVNDASEDSSLEIIRKTGLNASSTNVSVITMSYFHGLELSMAAGVDLSIGDFVFEFDCIYLDFDLEIIMKIYRRSLEGYDIVSASADRKEAFTSRVFYWMFAHYAELPEKMSTESFRVLSRRVINRISSMNKTVPYRKAVYTNCGLKTDRMKYKIVHPVVRDSDRKEHVFRSRLAIDALILFTDFGYRFAKTMTALMMIISVLMVVYSIVIYTASNPVAGWTTTILFLSVAFFGLFGVLTVVIKYLQLLVDLVFKRKHYSFESIEKITK